MSQQAPPQSRIELVFEKFSSFVEGYGANLSLGAMFLETEDLRPVDSVVDFEIKLTDGFRLIQGLGEVAWVRQQAAGSELPAGMAVRFQALDDKGRELVLKMLEEQVRGGGEPFDVDDVPEDVRLASAEGEAETADEAAAVMDVEPPSTMPDLEKKILGEDGFTLIDAEAAVADPPAVHLERSFEELAFDAPWGEELPEIPQEVLEEEVSPSRPREVPEAPLPEEPATTFESALEGPSPDEATSDPFADFDDTEGVIGVDAATADRGSGSSGDALEASLFLAEEAANEIHLAPQSEVLAEPDFHEIDFGASEAGGEDLTADFEDAFEPGPEDQLPPLSGEAQVADAAGTVSEPSFFEDATLLTSEPPAASPPVEDAAWQISEPEAAPFSAEGATWQSDEAEETSVSAEDATLLTSEPFAMPPPAGDSAWPVEQPEAASAFDAEDATWQSGEAEEASPVSEDATLLTSEAPAAAPEPAAPEPSTLDFGAAPIAREAVGSMDVAAPPAPASAPAAEPSSPAGVGTVQVGGATAAVQDYEDDLFAEDDSSGSVQVLRHALGGRSLVVIAVLAALLAAGYFLRDSLAELVGLGGPAPESSPSATAAEPPAVPESSPTAPTPAAPPDGAVESEGEIEAPIEEVDVAQSLPPGLDVSTDPAADRAAAAASEEVVVPSLAPAASPATRVERISWRRDDGGTRVTVTLDGELDQERSIHAPLGYNPAREMVRITGIAEPYASGRIAVESPELQQIRVGYHVKAGVSELHVVFDFPAAGPRVAEVQNLGDRIEVLISAR